MSPTPSLVDIVRSAAMRQAMIFDIAADGIRQHSFGTLCRDAAIAAERLRSWGVTRHMRVGIYAASSYEWLVHDLALIEIGAISVPFTDDFSGQIGQHLLDRYQISLLLISKANARLFSDHLAHVAFLDKENGEVRALPATPSGDTDLDDQLSLVFSSGSAGGLKGLVISRSGVASNLGPIVEALEMTARDRILLFLPMSNFQQRFACYAALRSGSDIILTNYRLVFDALVKLEPTIFLAPPIFYQMVHDEFQKKVAPAAKGRLDLAHFVGALPSSRLRKALMLRLFPQFYDQFGARMRTLMTGMAPLRPEISAFFAAMQIPLTETYGMVEAGVMAMRPAWSKDYGSVGRPLSDVRFVIGEGGEVFVHRPQFVALRYFQCAPDENERTFPEPGIIATGDVGQLNENGWLSLFGRKKEVITTAAGAKIHPEVVEKELLAYPGVAHAVLHMRRSDGRFICIIDLADPEDTVSRTAVAKQAASPKALRTIAPFVEVRFSSEPFSTQNGMLRPNLKIDRKAIVARYAGD